MRALAGVAAAGVAALLGGCALVGGAQQSWDATDDFGAPGAPIAAYSGVAYYPACGNETLTFDGEAWFPFDPANTDELPAEPLADAPTPSPVASALDGARGAGGAGMPAAIPVGAVAPPGPGDDVGTLVIYENDLAYWESDNGTLARWLTHHYLEYNWVC